MAHPTDYFFLESHHPTTHTSHPPSHHTGCFSASEPTMFPPTTGPSAWNITSSSARNSCSHSSLSLVYPWSITFLEKPPATPRLNFWLCFLTANTYLSVYIDLWWVFLCHLCFPFNYGLCGSGGCACLHLLLTLQGSSQCLVVERYLMKICRIHEYPGDNSVGLCGLELNWLVRLWLERWTNFLQIVP